MLWLCFEYNCYFAFALSRHLYDTTCELYDSISSSFQHAAISTTCMRIHINYLMKNFDRYLIATAISYSGFLINNVLM